MVVETSGAAVVAALLACLLDRIDGSIHVFLLDYGIQYNSNNCSNSSSGSNNGIARERQRDASLAGCMAHARSQVRYGCVALCSVKSMMARKTV